MLRVNAAGIIQQLARQVVNIDSPTGGFGVYGRPGGTEDFEVFRRSSDGSVSPASTELLQAFANRNTTLQKLGVDGLKDPKNRSVIEDCDHKVEEALKSSDEKK
jgi:hypothetical protein